MDISYYLTPSKKELFWSLISDCFCDPVILCPHLVLNQFISVYEWGKHGFHLPKK